MERRQALALLALVVGAGAVFYGLFSPESDEEKAERVVRSLAASVSFSEPVENPILFGNRLAERFEEVLAEDVDVSLPEVSSGLPRERGRLAFAAAQVLARYGALDVSVGALEFHLEPEGVLDATVTVSALVGGELRRDERRVRFGLERDGSDFRVSRIELGPVEPGD